MMPLSKPPLYTTDEDEGPQHRRGSCDWPCGWRREQSATWGCDHTRPDSECSCTELVYCSLHCTGSWERTKRRLSGETNRTRSILNSWCPESCSVLPGRKCDVLLLYIIVKCWCFFVINQKLRIRRRNAEKNPLYHPNIHQRSAFAFTVMSLKCLEVGQKNNQRFQMRWRILQLCRCPLWTAPGADIGTASLQYEAAPAGRMNVTKSRTRNNGVMCSFLSGSSHLVIIVFLLTKDFLHFVAAVLHGLHLRFSAQMLKKRRLSIRKQHKLTNAWGKSSCHHKPGPD